MEPRPTFRFTMQEDVKAGDIVEVNAETGMLVKSKSLGPMKMPADRTKNLVPCPDLSCLKIIHRWEHGKRYHYV